MKILLLEDDVILQEIIEEYLLENGYTVESFYDGEKALDAIGSGHYDLLLLDVNVPSIDGFEILEYLRDIGNTTPAVYITSLSGIDDLKKGFALGADDYLKKPFDLEELKARIERIAKSNHLQDEIEFDGMRFIPKAHQIITGGKVVEMRQKEAQVLEYFVRNQGKIVSVDEIIQNVWNDEHVPTHATIRTYIKNLRKILDKEYFDNIKERVLKVADTGIGIEKEVQEDIFKRYKRANIERGGFGIGLNIVLRICKQYRIKLALESEKGKGSTFVLTFPLVK